MNANPRTGKAASRFHAVCKPVRCWCAHNRSVMLHWIGDHLRCQSQLPGTQALAI